ncbi:MAG: nitrate reductase cytochrome c-type subunit [Methylococcales bacterium]|nr:nitrate reductase cytochrome c-type subunit [Methylococcales bacterium]
MKKSVWAPTVLMCLATISLQTIAGDVYSLRGSKELNTNSDIPKMKKWQPDRDPITRDYLQQPPLIPHKTEGYAINLRNNKCLNCHSWSNYKESGATKISLTHFKNRAGNELSNVAPRRYFCTQCHVPQVSAKPIAKNTFRPLHSLVTE